MHTYQYYWDELFNKNAAKLKDYLNYNAKIEGDHISGGNVEGYFKTKKYEKGTILADFIEDPCLGLTVVTDWKENRADIKAHVRYLKERILSVDVNGINIRGARRSGKTTLAMNLAKLLKEEYEIAIVADYIDVEVLPEWVVWVPTIKKLRKGQFAIVDETALTFKARRGMSKDNVSALEGLPVIAHIGCKYCTLTQLTSLSDINIMRFTDIDICKGYDNSAYAQKVIERTGLEEDPRDEYMMPADDYVFEGSYWKSWGLVTEKGGDHKFTIYMEKPDFVTDAMSRSYMSWEEKAGGNKGKAKEIALRAFKMMVDNDASAQSIFTHLTSRGFDVNLEQIYHIKEKYGKVKVNSIDQEIEAFFSE